MTSPGLEMFLAWLVVLGVSLWVLASRLLPWGLSALLSLYLGKAKVRHSTLVITVQLAKLLHLSVHIPVSLGDAKSF